MLRTFLLVGGLLLAAPAIAAEAMAMQQFSYQRMYELLYQFRSLPEEQINRLAFAIRLQDEEGRIPANTEAWIEYGSRTIEVPVDQFGLLGLPVSPQLAAANAAVLTNQPEGSIAMGLSMIIRQPPGEQPLDIAWLLAGMQQADAVMQARARIADHLVPEAVGVTLKFAADTRGQVIIHGESGEIDYRADAYNTVDIPLQRDALPDRIEITERPLVIFPLFEE